MVKKSPISAGDVLLPLGQEGPLQKEMAVHSSILTWEIPRTEEPGWLQSMGLQRVGHDWAFTRAHVYTQTHARTHARSFLCVDMSL